MLHEFAVAHPYMVIAISVAAAFYFTGVYLLVTSLRRSPDWVLDENGDLRQADHVAQVPQVPQAH